MKRLPSIGNGAKPRIGGLRASGFKLRLNQSIQKWISRAGWVELLRSLRDKTEQWLYFLEVPPDNQAERSLRLAVTKRKVSGGLARWIGLPRRQTC